jgi:hypothetical protein
MDFRKSLLKHPSKVQVNKLVTYVGSDNQRFTALVKVFLEGPYKITQRAAWVMSNCVEQHPELIKPHLKKILDYLNYKHIHNAVKRNTIRLLQYIEIPKIHYGRVVDLCFGYLLSKSEPVATKAFSITVLDKITSKEPDLRNELRIILEDQLPYAKPAFVVRAKRFLKKINA